MILFREYLRFSTPNRPIYPNVLALSVRHSVPKVPPLEKVRQRHWSDPCQVLPARLEVGKLGLPSQPSRSTQLAESVDPAGGVGRPKYPQSVDRVAHVGRPKYPQSVDRGAQVGRPKSPRGSGVLGNGVLALSVRHSVPKHDPTFRLTPPAACAPPCASRRCSDRPSVAARRSLPRSPFR